MTAVTAVLCIMIEPSYPLRPIPRCNHTPLSRLIPPFENAPTSQSAPPRVDFGASSRGCLAQLVEHRLYTARVGGSIPSAPTSMRSGSSAG